MIRVTRINNEEIIVNAVLIEFIEATPDTVISLISGRKLMVRESVEEVRARAVAYHHCIGLFPQPNPESCLSGGDQLEIFAYDPNLETNPEEVE
jgi:flagellar protein FlbD